MLRQLCCLSSNVSCGGSNRRGYWSVADAGAFPVFSVASASAKGLDSSVLSVAASAAPSGPMPHEAQAVAAFGWGFVMSGGEIEIVGPAHLELRAWDEHLDRLRAGYPRWDFRPTSARDS